MKNMDLILCNHRSIIKITYIFPLNAKPTIPLLPQTWFLPAHQFLLATDNSQKWSPFFLYVIILNLGLLDFTMLRNVFNLWCIERYRPDLQSDPNLTPFLGSTMYLLLKSFITMKRVSKTPIPCPITRFPFTKSQNAHPWITDTFLHNIERKTHT